MIDLRPCLTSAYSNSLGALITANSPQSRGSTLMFYDTKIKLFNRMLNATARRKTDQAAPEITLNPLDGISGMCTI